MILTRPSLNEPAVWPCSPHERFHYVDNPACHVCMTCDRNLPNDRCWVVLYGWQNRVSIQSLVKGFMCPECAEKDRKIRRNEKLKRKRACARGIVGRKSVAYASCHQCDSDYIIKKLGQSYCSAKCRVAAWRLSRRLTPSPLVKTATQTEAKPLACNVLCRSAVCVTLRL